MKLKKLARWIVEQTQRLNPETEWSELALVLMDEAGMAAANRACFGKDVSTDVISQTYAPMPPERLASAEVIVNVERARHEGPRFGGATRELTRYVAHGCQHLAGATDDDPAARARMHRLERTWLAAAEELHLLDDLIGASENTAHR